MKFKQNNEDNFSKELYTSFTKLLQIGEDQISLVEAAIAYFYMHGNMAYKKFFKYLHEQLIMCKLDIQNFLYGFAEKTPERTIHELKLESLSEDIIVFELLASAEDEYVEELNNAINKAYDLKQWDTFHYLLKKFDKIDHLCCRAVASVKDGSNILDLLPCEQHSLEK